MGNTLLAIKATSYSEPGDIQFIVDWHRTTKQTWPIDGPICRVWAAELRRRIDEFKIDSDLVVAWCWMVCNLKPDDVPPPGEKQKKLIDRLTNVEAVALHSQVREWARNPSLYAASRKA